MHVTFNLKSPNVQFLTCKHPGIEGVEIRAAAFETIGNQKERTLVDSLQIHGKPEQLISLADVIYKAFGKKEVDLPQPTADDEAARDFELLQEARKNTPEANMELPELEGKTNAA